MATAQDHIFVIHLVIHSLTHSTYSFNLQSAKVKARYGRTVNNTEMALHRAYTLFEVSKQKIELWQNETKNYVENSRGAKFREEGQRSPIWENDTPI